MNILFIKLAFTATALGAIVSGQLTTLPEVQTDALNNEEEIEIQEKTDYTTEWLDYVIPLLEQAESRGNHNAVNYNDAKITGYASEGCMQFQPATFRSVFTNYNILPHTEPNEIMNFYRDCEMQKIAARAILINEKFGWMHWRNSFINHNLPRSAEDYKKLK